MAGIDEFCSKMVLEKVNWSFNLHPDILFENQCIISFEKKTKLSEPETNFKFNP
jgi:hypothetical protein